MFDQQQLSNLNNCVEKSTQFTESVSYYLIIYLYYCRALNNCPITTQTIYNYLKLYNRQHY